MLRIGWHLPSNAQSFEIALSRINALMLSFNYPFQNVVQLFSKSPMSWRYRPDQHFLDSIYTSIQKHQIEDVFIHASYLLNFCRADERGVQSLCDDLGYIDYISRSKRTRGVVIHLGKNVQGRSVAECIEIFIQNINSCFASYNGDAKIILETSVKSLNNSDIFWDISVLAAAYNSLDRKIADRIMFCLDTCHLYASGYAIDTAEGVDKFFHHFDQLIGISSIALFHLNDSVKPIASCRDLHEDIGRGQLFNKRDALRSFLQYAMRYDIPCIVETPGRLSDPYASISAELEYIYSTLSTHCLKF